LTPKSLPNVRLEPARDDDVWLTVALETDPRVMSELGGPQTEEYARGAHRRRVEGIKTGNWWFKIVREPDGQAIGTIGLWPTEWAGAPISETGWMVLADEQGKGYASAALALLIEQAWADGRWGDIHAFPGATNAPSNALCRKFGFEQLETVEVDYGERRLTCNHWVLRAR
jgi:RimJ/RimL family protein N-acetyltransferase